MQNEKEKIEVVFTPQISGTRPVPDWREYLNKLTANQKIAVGILAGLTIGLIIGWLVWPVEWTDAGYESLTPGRQAEVIRLTSWVYAFSGNEAMVNNVLGDFPTLPETGCQMVILSPDEADRLRLLATFRVVGLECKQ